MEKNNIISLSVLMHECTRYVLPIAEASSHAFSSFSSHKILVVAERRTSFTPRLGRSSEEVTVHHRTPAYSPRFVTPLYLTSLVVSC